MKRTVLAIGLAILLAISIASAVWTAQTPDGKTMTFVSEEARDTFLDRAPIIAPLDNIITIYDISPSGHTIVDETYAMYKGPSDQDLMAIDYHLGWWKEYPAEYMRAAAGPWSLMDSE